MSEFMDVEKQEKVLLAAKNRVMQPMDPFTGRSLMDVLVSSPLKDPWVVGGTVWRPVYDLFSSVSKTDVDLLLSTVEDVEWLKGQFYRDWILDRNPYDTVGNGNRRGAGFRFTYGTQHIDVWTPHGGQDRREHVSKFPQVHQRLYWSAEEGLVDLRVTQECGCSQHAVVRAMTPLEQEAQRLASVPFAEPVPGRWRRHVMVPEQTLSWSDVVLTSPTSNEE